MDDNRFDLLTKSLSGGISRRSLLRSLAAAVGVAAVGVGQATAAPGGGKGDTDKKCYGGGSQCTNAKQCCSGTCTNRVCAPEGGGDPCATMNCADTNPCTTDGCAAGQCTHTAVAAGTACAGGFCNSSGTCVPAVCTPGSSESCYSGPEGTAGVGICKTGTRTCNATGQWGSCIGEILPTEEICGNGVDDDCDGAIDEGCGGPHCDDAAGPGTCPGEDNECQNRTCGAGLCGIKFFPPETPCQGGQCDGAGTCVLITCTPGSTQSCYSGTAGTEGVGICKTGIQTCGPNSQWEPCLGEVLPQTEICGNGKDDDCDGTIDGGCIGNECTTPENCMGQDSECQQRTCVQGYCGISNTPLGTPLTIQIAGDCILEICDGAGNQTTKPVQLGTACGEQGPSFQCDLSGQCREGVCTPDTSEACYSGSAVTLGVGPCASGIRTCGPTAEWGSCNGEILPTAEVCGSGVDADCDGQPAPACTGDECMQPSDCGSSTDCLTPTCIDGYCGNEGHCGTCTEASDCPENQVCYSYVCASGLCDIVFAPPTTPCPNGFCTIGACI